MAGVGGFIFLLTTFVTLNTSQVALSMYFLNLLIKYILPIQIFLTVIGFGLGACLYACIAIFGIVASESYPAHLSGTAHAFVALAANGNKKLSSLYSQQLIKFLSL